MSSRKLRSRMIGGSIHYSERESVCTDYYIQDMNTTGSRSEEAIIDNVQVRSVVSNIRIPRPLQSE